MKRKITKVNFLNYSILIPYLILSAIGIVMVFSVTVPYQLAKNQSPYKLTIMQGIFIIFSFLILFLIYKMKINFFKKKKIILFCLVILIFALIYTRFGPGVEVNGARRWIKIPGLGTVQPAEFVKIYIVWYLAVIFSNKQSEIVQKDIGALFKGNNIFQKIIGGWKLPIYFLIIMEVIMPDLGSTVIMIFITITMICASGISWKWFSYFIKISIIGTLAFISFLYKVNGNVIPGHYTNARFKAMVDPFNGLDSYGHQIANSYYAVVNGGWFGRGLGNSIQKNGFLPEAHTDFIFSIILEELGVIGGTLVLALFFFLTIRILDVGLKANDSFNSMICIGMSGMLIMSAFINIGGAFGLIPESGVTFPLFSQGGSSFLVISIGISLTLNISADEKRKQIINDLILKPIYKHDN